LRDHCGAFNLDTSPALAHGWWPQNWRAPPDLPLRVWPPEGDEETWERPGVSS